MLQMIPKLIEQLNKIIKDKEGKNVHKTIHVNCIYLKFIYILDCMSAINKLMNELDKTNWFWTEFGQKVVKNKQGNISKND